MSLQLDLKTEHLLSLEDAIAYEFFMESTPKIMEDAYENEQDMTEALAKLATASYMIANIFSAARSINTEQSNDTNA